MKSPWKRIRTLEPEREYFVFASSIPPRSYRSTWRLFRGSRIVTRQLEAAPGVVGFSLLARPLRKQYGTLSVWDDEQSLRAFAERDPHRRLMQQLAPEMGQTAFAHWTIDGAQGRPSWEEALDRLW